MVPGALEHKFTTEYLRGERCPRFRIMLVPF